MTKIGTLKELGVKPGDVVELVCGDFCGFSRDQTDKPKKLTVDDRGWASIGGFGYNPSLDEKYNRKFRLISRAAETPKLWRDMTPEEKGALLLAHHEGKSVEFTRSSMGYKWMIVAGRSEWCDGNAYRVKPKRTKSEWSEWFISKADGTTKLNLSECAEVERVQLGDGKQFAYRVKKWVE